MPLVLNFPLSIGVNYVIRGDELAEARSSAGERRQNILSYSLSPAGMKGVNFADGW